MPVPQKRVEVGTHTLAQDLAPPLAKEKGVAPFTAQPAPSPAPTRTPIPALSTKLKHLGGPGGHCACDRPRPCLVGLQSLLVEIIHKTQGHGWPSCGGEEKRMGEVLPWKTEPWGGRALRG